jgi:tetratricopeptide (TPR) repeat protein
LREKIGIDTLKQKLNKARGKWKKYAIENIELNAANTILEHLYQYPWQTTNDYGSFPKDIIDHKEIHCTWFSAIGRRFLLELWIEHKALNIPDHSSLEISIWWEIYYFDAATYGKIYRFHYGRKVWDFRKIEFYDEEKTPINTYAILWNAEIIIQSQMLSNLWHILFIKWETKKAIEMYRKAININPKNISAMNNLSNALIEEWLLDEAANILKKAIELYSRLPHLWGNLWRVFIKKWKYEEATSLFKKAINLKNSPQYHYWLWEALDKQWKTDESIKAFQESIILKDNMPILYERLWNILIKAWYEESWNLFLFVYNIMRQKWKRYQNQKLTIQEEKILQLVQKKKLWSLRRLLFSQIKKEMRIVAKENKKRKW